MFGAVYSNALLFYGFWLIHYLNRRHIFAGLPSGIHREQAELQRSIGG
jgi:hypothetical protein